MPSREGRIIVSHMALNLMCLRLYLSKGSGTGAQNIKVIKKATWSITRVGSILSGY